jgi:hypothetical protein
VKRWRSEARKVHTLPLSPAALLDNCARGARDDAKGVSLRAKPASGSEAPMAWWHWVCGPGRAEGMDDYTIFDARSRVGAGGASHRPPIRIGQSSTTQRYAHLVGDLVREAADKIARQLWGGRLYLLSPSRCSQPVCRYVSLLCHLLDSVAFISCRDDAQPYGFVGLAINVPGRQR